MQNAIVNRLYATGARDGGKVLQMQPSDETYSIM